MTKHRLSDHANVDVRAQEALVKAIMPILAGKGPEVQSAALADLTSMWLSGMFIVGDEEATQKLRDFALGMFIDTVLSLTPINEAIYTRPKLEKMKQ